jgi:hypothetical protein
MPNSQDEPRHPDGKSQQQASRDLEAGQAQDTTSSSDELEIESIHEGDGGDGVDHISTHVSLGPDNPVEQWSSFVEIPDEFYNRLSPRRKIAIVAILSYCSFLAPISSTMVLSAIPEVAAEYNTTGSVVDLSNALYMLFMGISPIVWGPLSEVYGRRMVSRLGMECLRI